MTTYVLEMRSTANWQDVRYREYTTSPRKADLFKDVPKVQFTDSGHGIVPHVREHRGRREPRNMLLADHVRDHITAKGREVKAIHRGPDLCPSCDAGTRHWWSYCAMCGYHIASGALSRPEKPGRVSSHVPTKEI